MSKVKNYLIIFFLLLIFVLTIFVFKLSGDLTKIRSISNQNELALRDSLKIIKSKNTELYHKYIEYRNLDSLLKKEILNKESSIKQYQRTIVQLNRIISQSKYDSVLVSPVDTTYYFSKSTSFYRYNLKINLPNHYLDLEFYPFSITSYITEKDGIISNYLEVPDSLKPFIKISDVKTIFQWENKTKPTNNLSILPLIGYSDKFIFGGGIVYNNFYFSYLSNKTFLIGYLVGF